jgi:hypothetical protein
LLGHAWTLSCPYGSPGTRYGLVGNDYRKEEAR